MLIPENVIYQVLVDDPNVVFLIGGTSNPRIYPQSAPQNTNYPYMVYHRIDAQRPHHMGGPSGIVMSRIQIDFYDNNYDGVMQLAEYARMALNGYRGLLTINGETADIRDVNQSNDYGDIVEPQGAQSLGIFRTVHDYVVTMYEAA